MNLHRVAHGRFFNALDEEKAHAVCVIGPGIRDSLFGDQEEVGPAGFLGTHSTVGLLTFNRKENS
jgi:hypothetical protein